MMTPEEDRKEKELFISWKETGNLPARDEILTRSLKHIRNIAFRMAHTDNINLQPDELFGVGQLAAFKWLDLYAPQSSTPPPIYIAQGTRKDMTQHIRNINGRNNWKKETFIPYGSVLEIDTASSSDWRCNPEHLASQADNETLRGIFLSQANLTERQRSFVENALSETPLNQRELAKVWDVTEGSITHLRKALFKKMRSYLQDTAQDWIPESAR